MQLTDTVNSQGENGDEGDAASAEVRANRYDVLSRLAENLAHEIKNPLNAIVVNLEVLRRRVASGAADAALDRAGVIEHEVRRVHSLIEQLLQLLRPARSDVAPVAVDTILESLAPAFQVQARSARVTLTCNGATSLYAQVRSDGLQFALLNLVAHAIDEEAKTGGTVTIEARRAADEIYVVVTCSRARLLEQDEQIRFCRILMDGAGGALESVEPNDGDSGSTATLVMPASAFA